ncbi:DUF945 family protein [Aliikangiella maris]|uniref:DUF945 family protein n=2 Tax=Aliikangiella maris TaxID=3162458 RepID=A0ABV2BW57_9GAMM
MKKLIIIILALVLITPFLIGLKVETEYRILIDNMNADPTYHIEITAFNKGWLTSDAKVKITPVLPFNEQEQSPFELQLIQNLQHGPLLWRTNGLGFGLVDSSISFEFPADIQQQLNKVNTSNKEPLSITSRTSFDLSSKIHLELLPFKIIDNQFEVEVKQGTSLLTVTPDGQLKGQSSWGGISLKDELNQQIAIEKSSTNIDMTLVTGEMFSPNAIFAGMMDLSIESMVASGNDPTEKLTFKNMKLNAQSDANLETVGFKFALSSQLIESAFQKFEDFNFNFQIENFDTKTSQAISELLTKVQAGTVDPMQSSVQFQDMLPALIAKNPIIKITQLGATTTSGKLNNQLQVQFDQQIYDANNPMTMITAINATASGYAPEVFFNELGMAANIEQLVSQQYLKRENDNLTYQFSFKNGQALLNNQPIPLGMF